MKQAIYSALGILLSATLAHSAMAQTPAQNRTQTYITLPGCTDGTSVVDYLSKSCSPNIEKRSDREAVGNTSFTFSNYSSTVSGASTTASTTNDIFQYTDDYSSQILGTSLVWRQNSTNTSRAGAENTDVNIYSPFKAKVLLTFSREVTNLKLVFQDIDKALISSNGGSDFTDEVDFYPMDKNGRATDISSGNVVVGYGTGNPYYIYSNTCKYLTDTRDGVTQAILQGTGLNGGAISQPSRNGNATIVFKKPVKSIWLTYRNLNTISYRGVPSSQRLRLQTIAIEEISWCTVKTLPVTLTEFGAKTAGPDARLTWATANEANNDYFAVERSFDGVAFNQIGRLSGQGTTTASSSYTYTDPEVANQAAGTVYYRLRQVDQDGTATYSPVRTVAFEKGGAMLKLYPNPATSSDDKLMFDMLALPQGDYQATLINVVGSTVATYTVHGGENQPVALPATLVPGTYIVRLQGQGVNLTQRLARQ